MCSLAAQASEGWSSVFRGSVIGRGQLALWASGMERFAAARARYPAIQFADVWYDDLVADPLRTVQRVYASFGLRLSEAAADAMRALALGGGGSANGSRPAHRYTLADFGLSAEEVEAAFAGI
jgi:hypothetical protein